MMDDSGGNPFGATPEAKASSACGSSYMSNYDSAHSMESLAEGGTVTSSLGGVPVAPPPPAPPAAEATTVHQTFQDLDISTPPPVGGTSSQAAPRFDATAGESVPGGGASPDLAVSVANPSKIGDGYNAYYTYEVKTKTSLPQYKHQEFTVTRRFRDFEWLYKALGMKFPGAIMPPLPEKHSATVSTMKVTGVSQSAAFLEVRRAELQRFLHRLVAHPMLHSAPDLQAFLEKEGETLEPWKELSKPPKVASSSYSASLSDSSSWMYNKSMSLLGGDGPSATFTPMEDKPCLQMGNYASALKEQVTCVHQHSKSYIERHRALGQSMTGFGLALTQLANCETETNQSLAMAISSMGLCVGRLSSTYSELAEREVSAFEEPMRDYIKLLAAVKEAIAARDKALRAHNEASRGLLTKKERLDKLRASGGKEDKISALEREVKEAEEAEDLAKADYEMVKARVDAEMGRFQSEKLVDFKRCVTSFLRLQIEYSERIQASWRELLPRLEEINGGGGAAGNASGAAAAGPTPVD